MKRTILLAMIATGLTSPVLGQTRPATGSLTIERPLTIVAVRPMRFDRADSGIDAVPSRSATEAIIQITGDPGRIYRVRLPETIDADDAGSLIGSFTIWSDNAGDISQTLTAHMDSEGVDRLHVAGLLRRVDGIAVTDVLAAIPLSIDYE